MSTFEALEVGRKICKTAENREGGEYSVLAGRVGARDQFAQLPCGGAWGRVLPPAGAWLAPTCP